MICRIPFLLFWLNCRVLEGSAGELKWAFHAWRSLDRMRFGPLSLYFYLTVWFQRESCEALLAITIMRHDSRSMVK
jgi:hypothetical protein